MLKLKKHICVITPVFQRVTPDFSPDTRSGRCPSRVGLEAKAQRTEPYGD